MRAPWMSLLLYIGIYAAGFHFLFHDAMTAGQMFVWMVLCLAITILVLLFADRLF